MSTTRIRAIFRKELREYRRNRSIVWGMALMSLMYLVITFLLILSRPATDPQIGAPLFFMLFIPTIIPAAAAGASVVGEREQGTLEPVLTTPIRSEEFLLGKALAVLVPTLVISYGVVGLILVCLALFAHPGVASAVAQGSGMLLLLLFTPLLAGWSIWVGIAISARSPQLIACLKRASYSACSATSPKHVVRCLRLDPPAQRGRTAPSARLSESRLVSGSITGTGGLKSGELYTLRLFAGMS